MKRYSSEGRHSEEGRGKEKAVDRARNGLQKRIAKIKEDAEADIAAFDQQFDINLDSSCEHRSEVLKTWRFSMADRLKTARAVQIIIDALKRI